MINPLNPEKVSELKSLLLRKNTFLIATHLNADGDAIGSSLALALVLKKMGKSVQVVTSNDYPAFLKWMEGNDMVLVHRHQSNQVKNAAARAEVLLCLDFNDPKRLDTAQEDVMNSPAYRVLIDHHPNPVDFANLVLSETSYGSTAELLYSLLLGMGFEKYMDAGIAACVYAGILTDTGGFSYSCSYPEVWKTVAALMAYGIDKDLIHSLVYDNYSKERMRLMGYCLYEKMLVFPEYNTAVISLSKAEMDSFNHQPGDTEGFVNLPFNIKGIRFSVLFLEKKNHIKISFRSRGSFNVNKFANDHFRGGGHVNASGGEWDKPLDEAVKRFINLLEHYKDQLQ
jgi:phosphoesterase RecJ-like protein